jgi:rhodanese-related sulfurtransferase
MAKHHSPGFLKIVSDARSRVRECTIHDLKARMESANPPIVIDVREESEYAAGHIPGAIHLSKGIIERDIEERFPNPSVELFLRCGGGFRSAMAADNLGKMGYTNVTSVDGGWRGWCEAQYPAVN